MTTDSLNIPSNLVIHSFGLQQPKCIWSCKAVRPLASRKSTFSFEKVAANMKLGTVILLGAIPIPFVVETTYLEIGQNVKTLGSPFHLLHKCEMQI